MKVKKNITEIKDSIDKSINHLYTNISQEEYNSLINDISYLVFNGINNSLKHKTNGTLRGTLFSSLSYTIENNIMNFTITKGNDTYSSAFNFKIDTYKEA